MLSSCQNQVVLHEVETVIHLRKFGIFLYQIALFTTLKTTLFCFKSCEKNYLVNEQHTDCLNKLFVLKVLSFSVSYFCLVLQISLKVSIFSDILLDNSVVFLFGIFLLVHASCLTVVVKRVSYGMFLTSKNDMYLISDYNITINPTKIMKIQEMIPNSRRS